MIFSQGCLTRAPHSAGSKAVIPSPGVGFLFLLWLSHAGCALVLGCVGVAVGGVGVTNLLVHWTLGVGTGLLGIAPVAPPLRWSQVPHVYLWTWQPWVVVVGVV